jgi:hypothetical protein
MHITKIKKKNTIVTPKPLSFWLKTSKQTKETIKHRNSRI